MLSSHSTLLWLSEAHLFRVCFFPTASSQGLPLIITIPFYNCSPSFFPMPLICWRHQVICAVECWVAFFVTHLSALTLVQWPHSKRGDPVWEHSCSLVWGSLPFPCLLLRDWRGVQKSCHQVLLTLLPDSALESVHFSSSQATASSLAPCSIHYTPSRAVLPECMFSYVVLPFTILQWPASRIQSEFPANSLQGPLWLGFSSVTVLVYWCLLLTLS